MACHFASFLLPALPSASASLARPKTSLGPLTLAASSPRSTSTPKTSTSSAPSTPKLPRGSGLKKPLDISPALQQFLGAPQASRAETMKLIWDYIKSNGLQSESDRRLIVCDEKLKELLGKEQVNFLELAKLLNPHFLKTNQASHS